MNNMIRGHDDVIKDLSVQKFTIVSNFFCLVNICTTFED